MTDGQGDGQRATDKPLDRPSARPSDDVSARWVSFADLADLRGISRASASKLVRRHGWRRQADNQGRVLILVPAEALDRPQDSPADRPAPMGQETDRPSDSATFNAALTVIHEAHAVETEALREQLLEARHDRDRERERADEARNRADAADADRRAAIGLAEQTVALLREAETRVSAGREHADMLRDRLNAMQEQLSDAHAALEAAASADARAQQAEAGWDAERMRADRAEQGREADRARADGLQAKLDDMQERLTARQEVVDAAEAIRKADDARLARSRWVRLRAAWRGE